jgi:hypothetical protein
MKTFRAIFLACASWVLVAATARAADAAITSPDGRAYDDGVAFRYRLDDAAPVKLRGERTAFVPEGDPSCLVAPAEGAHEVTFERLRLSQLKEGVAYDVPLVCATPSGRTRYAITQARLQGYTGASLWREGGAVHVRLSSVPGAARGGFRVGERTDERLARRHDGRPHRRADRIESHRQPQPAAAGRLRQARARHLQALHRLRGRVRLSVLPDRELGDIRKVTSMRTTIRWPMFARPLDAPLADRSCT